MNLKNRKLLAFSLWMNGAIIGTIIIVLIITILVPNPYRAVLCFFGGSVWGAILASVILNRIDVFNP
jgi:hypothetical protein